MLFRVQAFFLYFNQPQSLNNVGKGFRALAANIGKLLVLAFSNICLEVWFGIFYRCKGLADEHTEGEVHHTACLVGGKRKCPWNIILV